MRSLRSTLFASPLAAFLSVTMVTGSLTSLTGCSSAPASESVGEDSMVSALSSTDPSTVNILDASGKVLSSKTVSTEGLSITADVNNQPVFNFEGGAAFTMVGNVDLGGGFRRITMLTPTGDQIVFKANTNGHGTGTDLGTRIHPAIAVVLIGALVVVSVAVIAFWSQGRCLDYLLASQRLCPGNHTGDDGKPATNWSGRCSGGSWKDGWQYTAEATCAQGDPRPLQPAPAIPAQPAPAPAAGVGAGADPDPIP